MTTLVTQIADTSSGTGRPRAGKTHRLQLAEDGTRIAHRRRGRSTTVVPGPRKLAKAGMTEPSKDTTPSSDGLRPHDLYRAGGITATTATGKSPPTRDTTAATTADNHLTSPGATFPTRRNVGITRGNDRAPGAVPIPDPTRPGLAVQRAAPAARRLPRRRMIGAAAARRSLPWTTSFWACRGPRRRRPPLWGRSWLGGRSRFRLPMGMYTPGIWEFRLWWC